VVLNCAHCHQFPFVKARDYIAKFSDLPDEQREKVWYDVMRFMRVKAVSIAPAGLDPGIEKMPLPAFADDRINGFSHADELAMAPVLTRYMPRSFDHYPLADYEKLLAPIGGPGTVIREYQLPQPAVSMFHDSAIAPLNGKLYVYSVDFINYRMTRVNVATGEIRTLPLPKGMIGGHPLVPDAEGYIWATIMISGQIARFDAKSETWTTWNTGNPGGAEFGGGGGGFVHSLGFKAGFEIGFDGTGGVWASLIGTNQLIRLDPKTGKTATVDAPGTNEAPEVGDRTFVSGLYGLVMTADGGHIWATQLEGSVFSVNTRTMRVEDVLPIPRGDGPRRLAIDRNDTIYVPLNGAGQLFVYDTKAKREIGRFPLPDRAAATYAVNWDAKRNAIWLASGNAAKVYKFDVASKAFTEYPMPRTEGVFIRSLPIDQTTGDVYFSYAPIASLKGPNMVVWLRPDDAETAKTVAALDGGQAN
jgi:streptogramin lyase